MDTNNNPTLYVVNISSKLGKNFIPIFEDIVRMFIIQVTIQFMFYLSDPSQRAFFTEEFILLVFYITLGVLMYWLVFKGLVKFT
jgi:hypothetical protein